MFKRIVQNLFFVMVMSLTVVAQTQPAANTQEQAGKTSIIIDRQLVRFVAAGEPQEWHLVVADQQGAVIFDSGPSYGAALEWPLQNSQGEAVTNGLYAYTLTTKSATDEAARVRRGHFIVDRAKERDGKTDRLWITSQNDSGMGTELTVARNERETIAGASATSEQQGLNAGDKEQANGTGGEAESKTKRETKEAALAPAAVIGKTTIQGSEDPLLEIDHTGASGHPAMWFKQDGVTKAYMWWDRVYSNLNLGTPGFNPIMSLEQNGKVYIRGSVGIGNTQILPFNKLQVRGLGNETGVFAESTGAGAGVHGQSLDGNGVRGTATGFGAGIYGEVGFGGSGHAGVFQGKVFINGLLTVANNVLPYNDNAFTLGSATQRWKTVYAANGTIQTSDARMKRDVTNLRYGLRELMMLRPVSFAWKDPSDQQQHLGLIAQETEEIIPEAIAREADPDITLGLNYSSLIPVVIKAIQEQQTTITSLKSENEALHQQNDDLHARLRMLEQRMLPLKGQSQSRTSKIKNLQPLR